MGFLYKNIFGEKPKHQQFFYPLMETMNISNNYDALIIEWVIRYLSEQMGMNYSNITSSLVAEIAAYAKLRVGGVL